jgi:hypothetical protein
MADNKPTSRVRINLGDHQPKREELLTKAVEHAHEAAKLLRRSYPEREQAHQMRTVDAHTALAAAYARIAAAIETGPSSDDTTS